VVHVGLGQHGVVLDFGLLQSLREAISAMRRGAGARGEGGAQRDGQCQGEGQERGDGAPVCWMQ
jgi:hypothetical protein